MEETEALCQSLLKRLLERNDDIAAKLLEKVIEMIEDKDDVVTLPVSTLLDSVEPHFIEEHVPRLAKVVTSPLIGYLEYDPSFLEETLVVIACALSKQPDSVVEKVPEAALVLLNNWVWWEWGISPDVEVLLEDFGRGLIKRIPPQILTPYVETVIVDKYECSYGEDFDALLRATSFLPPETVLPYAEKVIEEVFSSQKGYDLKSFVDFLDWAGKSSEWRKMLHTWVKKRLTDSCVSERVGKFPDWLGQPYWEHIRERLRKGECVAEKNLIVRIIKNNCLEDFMFDLVLQLRTHENAKVLVKISDALLDLPKAKLTGLVIFLFGYPDCGLFKNAFYLISKLDKQTLQENRALLSRALASYREYLGKLEIDKRHPFDFWECYLLDRECMKEVMAKVPPSDEREETRWESCAERDIYGTLIAGKPFRRSAGYLVSLYMYHALTAGDPPSPQLLSMYASSLGFDL